MSAVQPWRLLGTSDLGAICRGLQPLAAAWAEEWLPGNSPVLEVADACDHPLLHAGPGEQMLTLQRTDGGVPGRLFFCDRLAASLRARTVETLGIPSGQGGAGTLVASVVAYQLRDLLARLARQPADMAREASAFKLSGVPHIDLRQGSGSVLLTVTLTDDRARVWLSQQAVRDWCRPHPAKAIGPALASRLEAIAKRRLGFKLLAGDASLRLADVMALQPGNVIRLDTGPDQPMALVTDSGVSLGPCYLGMLNGQPVIQFCK